MRQSLRILVWGVVIAAIVIPIAAAAMSPQLAWRDPIYITAGFAGVGAMTILLLQPMLAGRYLPGLSPRHTRLAHRFMGGFLVIALLVHVVGLWVTSPPDMIDALLLRSPTPFSIWGVLAMWTILATALVAILKRRLRVSLRVWRIFHFTFAAVAVISSVVHAMMIEGTMGTYSKTALCILVLAVTIRLAVDLRRRAQK